LQTEINCDQVYPKIYFVKWTECIGECCWQISCNSQTSHTECNRHEQYQHCQFTSCTRFHNQSQCPS